MATPPLPPNVTPVTPADIGGVPWVYSGSGSGAGGGSGGGVQAHEFDHSLRVWTVVLLAYCTLYLIAYIACNALRRRSGEGAVSSTSLPFQLCCFCGAVATAAIVGVPITTLGYTQLDFTDSQWIDGARLADVWWRLAVRGCMLCVFVVLPFAYFFQESSSSMKFLALVHASPLGRPTVPPPVGWMYWRAVAHRARQATIETLMVVAIMIGICMVVQAVPNGAVVLKFPSAILAAVLVIPGLAMFVLFTPSGLKHLIVLASTTSTLVTVGRRELTEQLEVVEREIVTAQERLRRAFNSAAAQVVPDDRLRMHSVPSPRTRDARDTHTAELKRLEAKQQMLLADLRMSIWRRLLSMLPRQLRKLLANVYIGIPAVLSSIVVARAAIRPFAEAVSEHGILSKPGVALAVSHSSTGTWAVVFDVTLIGYFVAASVVGMYYTGGSWLSRSVQAMKPAMHDTTILGLLGNVMILLLMAFCLPIAAWIFGLGAFDLLTVVSSQYDNIPWFHSKVLVYAYNLWFVISAASLVVKTVRQVLPRVCGRTKHRTH